MKQEIREVWISWNGWLEDAIRNYPRESCGILYTSRPYDSTMENWHIIPVKNVSPTPLSAWQPDRQELEQAKEHARNGKWTQLGNVHTHPHFLRPAPDDALPSDVDLRFARRYNNAVRGVITIAPGENGTLRFFDYCFHDQFGQLLDIEVANWEGYPKPSNIQLPAFMARKAGLEKAEKELLSPVIVQGE